MCHSLIRFSEIKNLSKCKEYYAEGFTESIAKHSQVYPYNIFRRILSAFWSTNMGKWLIVWWESINESKKTDSSFFSRCRKTLDSATAFLSFIGTQSIFFLPKDLEEMEGEKDHILGIFRSRIVDSSSFKETEKWGRIKDKSLIVETVFFKLLRQNCMLVASRMILDSLRIF